MQAHPHTSGDERGATVSTVRLSVSRSSPTALDAQERGPRLRTALSRGHWSRGHSNQTRKGSPQDTSSVADVSCLVNCAGFGRRLSHSRSGGYLPARRRAAQFVPSLRNGAARHNSSRCLAGSTQPGAFLERQGSTPSVRNSLPHKPFRQFAARRFHHLSKRPFQTSLSCWFKTASKRLRDHGKPNQLLARSSHELGSIIQGSAPND